MQQKKNLYAAVRRLTNLDIEAVGADRPEELEAVINDAVAVLRYRLIGSEHAARMDRHNADYGFARNFTGLRPFWLSFAVASAVGCWVAYGWFRAGLLWALVATALAVGLSVVGMAMLPEYVKVRAGHYAESFLSTVLELDRATSGNGRRDEGQKAGA
jgi:hypothetical protein